MNTKINYSAMILAGGKGTRIQSVLGDLPKALAPVGGRVFVTYLLDQLCEAGFQKVILCLGYQSEMIQQALGNEYKSMKLEFSTEPETVGTAGALRYALPLIKNENVIVLNGDTYVENALNDFNVAVLGQENEGLGIVQVEDASRFGLVEHDQDGCIIRFQEKSASAQSGWINAGIYFLKKKTIERISAFQSVSLERDIFPALIREKKLYAFPLAGKFVDIGTPESYAQAEDGLLLAGRSEKK